MPCESPTVNILNNAAFVSIAVGNIYIPFAGSAQARSFCMSRMQQDCITPQITCENSLAANFSCATLDSRNSSPFFLVLVSCCFLFSLVCESSEIDIIYGNICALCALAVRSLSSMKLRGNMRSDMKCECISEKKRHRAKQQYKQRSEGYFDDIREQGNHPFRKHVINENVCEPRQSSKQSKALLRLAYARALHSLGFLRITALVPLFSTRPSVV